jgi:hypothetical protein
MTGRGIEVVRLGSIRKRRVGPSGIRIMEGACDAGQHALGFLEVPFLDRLIDSPKQVA